MLRINGLLMLVSGLVWSLVPAMMFDITNPQAPFILFILAGLSAGATVQAGSYSFGAIAFVLPIFVTLTVSLLLAGSGRDYIIAIDSVFYLILLLTSARKAEKAMVKTVMLRIEATALAASLNQEHKASKAAAARFFHLANHDALTGLVNRAAFSTHLNDWLARCHVDRESFYLFLLDLDHFKSINDTLGHSAGDGILRETARRLTQTFPGENVVARLGGDEFAILAMPATVGPEIGLGEDEGSRTLRVGPSGQDQRGRSFRRTFGQYRREYRGR